MNDQMVANSMRQECKTSTHTAVQFTSKGLFVSPLIHVYWVVLSRFNSIASQNTSQSIPIHTNTHGIEITEQGLMYNESVKFNTYWL
jgi:hypothetical protein